MDLKSIQEKLNNEFKGSERKLVFWYDDNAEFVNEVDSIALNNAKVYKLEPNNWFYTKYFLEIIDKTTNYLVYAPFPKPADRDNHLIDTVYYSKLFYADRISLIMLDLNIPDKFKEHLKAYHKFWNSNERIDKFTALEIEDYTEEIINIGILSVLSGVKMLNFDEILRVLIVSGEFENNKYVTAFGKMDILGVFWQLCQKYYGYSSENPTLKRFVTTMLITYTSYNFNGDLPKAWSNYISSKKNDVAVFVSNFMNNMNYKNQYIALCEEIGDKIKVEEHMKEFEIENFIDCDTFSVFDEIILKKLVAWINEESVTKQGLIPKISAVLESRLKKYFAHIYINEYKALEAVVKLIGGLQLPEVGDDIVDEYVKNIHLIDRYYRKFYYYFDQIENNSDFLELRKLIENIYTNTYLYKLSIVWGDKIKRQYREISKIPHNKQYNFYSAFVEHVVKKEVTVVIISDALRYECAAELNERLNDDVKYNSELDYMISCVPSCTKLGMAALLPHKQISVAKNYDVLVDGQAVISTEQRQKVMENHRSSSIACLYSDIISLGRDDIRKLLTGKELIYIYHNQIDARGDNVSTENEVFSACEEAFNEITKLVRKLTADKSVTNYIITADHGFIYKRDKLGESDKVNMSKYNDAYKNKRFILSTENIEIDGTLKFSLDYLGNESKSIYVTVPHGADIFKFSGGGQNYVHGGASLQELIVPVIKLKTSRYKKETGYVEVALVSLSKKITNLITYLDFMQNENVSTILKPMVLKIYFVDNKDEKISNENIIYADKRNEPPERRMFREKFTFRNRKYSKSENYYLVVFDDKEDMEIGRYEFIIDIVFSDNFGFGV